MVNVLVQHQVKDYAAWRKVFDSVKDARKSSGAVSEQVYRDASDSNKITGMFKWDSLEHAQKFMQSSDLRTAMQNAGVIGVPTVTYLNEA